MKRWGSALLLAAVLVLAHAGPVGVVMNQSARSSGPGDRLAVIFPPGVPAIRALEALGVAGTMLIDADGMPWFYRVRVVNGQAAQRLAAQAWVMKIPGPPRFAGCFAPPPSPYRG